MSKIQFTELGWEDYLYWQFRDKKILKRINNLLKSIERDGAGDGLGQPEKLKYLNDEFSRRINDSDRLVYMVTDGVIIVISCRGHYEK